jgi:hypothetical protein
VETKHTNRPPTIEEFPLSSIIEVKGTSRSTLSYSYDDYQTAGVFDRAILLSTAFPKYSPAVTFITTFDVRFPKGKKGIASRAETLGVTVFQAVAIERCSSPGGYIKVGDTELKNNPIGLIPSSKKHKISSEFVRFQAGE